MRRADCALRLVSVAAEWAYAYCVLSDQTLDDRPRPQRARQILSGGARPHFDGLHRDRSDCSHRRVYRRNAGVFVRLEPDGIFSRLAFCRRRPTFHRARHAAEPSPMTFPEIYTYFGLPLI